MRTHKRHNNTLAHSDAATHKRAHTHLHTITRARARAHTHAHTHAKAHAHIQTQTNANDLSYTDKYSTTFKIDKYACEHKTSPKHANPTPVL